MKNEIFRIRSITQQHRILLLPGPMHPLLSVFRLEDAMHNAEELSRRFALDFYCISLKKGFRGKFRYGQNYYDFDEGLISFIGPGQVLQDQSVEEYALQGICLSFHPDFIRGYPLAGKIQEYGFFSYAVNEALHLSEQEEKMIVRIMEDIEAEYRQPIDSFSQDVVIAHTELLLTYCNRFYNRQFLTRKPAHNDLLARIDALLDSWFNTNGPNPKGLPAVEVLAAEVHLSARYLSDMLRSLTGLTTQQYIHEKLVERAKLYLAGTTLSVAEIAYRLGFERPQSFNKLFRHKTHTTPLQYRKSFS